MTEQVEDGAILGLEAAPFGVTEPLLGEMEGSQVDKGLASAIKAFLETSGKRAERRGTLRLGPDDGDRVGQQRRPLRVGGTGAPCRYQKQSFALPERVMFDAAQDRVLIALRQGAQGIGERRADGSLIDFALRVRGEPCCEGVTARDPRLAAAEEMRDGSEAQAVFMDEGMDNASFIHRGRGTTRRVGAQEQEFEFGRGTGTFDHSRRKPVPLVDPAGQALESVDDFERAVPAGRDANRQLGG